MSRRSFPRIAPADLRDHADEARIGRVWERIERDLGGEAAAAAPSRRAGLLYVAIAATFAAFGGGLLVGKVAWDHRAPEAMPSKSPDKISVEVHAAGTQIRAVPLPGGGRLTLSPGTTVELERTSADALTLNLLQGEASIDTAGAARKALAIVAGDARLNTQAGSVLSVRRNQDDLDVTVNEGTVDISSPAGSQRLGRNEHQAVPIHTTTVASAPIDAPAPRMRVLPPRRPVGPAAKINKTASIPDWLARYDANDFDGAFTLLKKRDISATIDAARSARELMAIATVVRGKGDRSAEIRANERLVKGFASDQRASLAAGRLADLYQGSGEADLAKTYRDQVGPLARNATTGSDSLFCNLISGESDKTKAALLAKEYLDKYPDGECHEKFEKMLQGNGLAPAPDPAPASSDAPSAPPAPAAPPTP
jgi:hypothetical protein